MRARCGPTRSAERLIAVINMRWWSWETKARRNSPHMNLWEGGGCLMGLTEEHINELYTHKEESSYPQRYTCRMQGRKTYTEK